MLLQSLAVFAVLCSLPSHGRVLSDRGLDGAPRGLWETSLPVFYPSQLPQHQTPAQIHQRRLLGGLLSRGGAQYPLEQHGPRPQMSYRVRGGGDSMDETGIPNLHWVSEQSGEGSTRNRRGKVWQRNKYLRWLSRKFFIMSSTVGGAQRDASRGLSMLAEICSSYREIQGLRLQHPLLLSCFKILGLPERQ
ncbi:unnamed protein product [Discosporangium mesarthrocarpum]